MLFNDRRDAGRQLVPPLSKYKGQPNVLVLGLARGGVVTAYEVASGLGAPLNVVVVRKVGAPGNEELAVGAIAENGEGIFNEQLIEILAVTQEYLQKEVERQKKNLKERLELYRGNSPAPAIEGKIVILVDDGIATGASMRVAVKSVRDAGAKKIVLAVPVAAPDSLRKIQKEVDEVVCLSSPIFFEAVGAFYKQFDQTTDQEVIQLLHS